MAIVLNLWFESRLMISPETPSVLATVIHKSNIRVF